MQTQPKYRLTPYCQTADYPTRVWIERFEYVAARGEQIWSSVRIFDTTKSAISFLRQIQAA